jgi:hypothetical protein
MEVAGIEEIVAGLGEEMSSVTLIRRAPDSIEGTKRTKKTRRCWRWPWFGAGRPGSTCRR